jgi:hypothetical protein
MQVMSVEEFRDRDADYLSWVAAHRDGYVINIGRSGRGYARLHRASCGTITSRPPFTGPYIKICSAGLAELDRWSLRRNGMVPERCGSCQPPVSVGYDEQTEPAGSVSSPSPPTGQEWEIEGPGDEPQVRLWSLRYIPFERLSPDQRAALDALKLRVRSLTATTGEILDASFAGAKPANMDVENVVLYNIDAAVGGCFSPGARHGVRFEMATRPRRDPPSGQQFACSYQYRLISSDSQLRYWWPVRQLASFTGADLGRFPSVKRLEQVWLAIHRTEVQTARAAIGPTTPFAVFLTLEYPRIKTVGADPELVKALIDGTVAAFQAHGDPASAAEIAARLAVTTGRQARLIEQALLDDARAVLGLGPRLVCLRGTGVQWNPCDHMCMAGQVLCREGAGDTWRLSGEVWAAEPRRQTHPGPGTA